ncbi:MAG TPA: hypothetical protein VGQ62_21405 [Chloroflexota bacterium]|jgi:hypothetical protein|nr:hypothetical protein [Chloroflexota bacterium]
MRPSVIGLAAAAFLGLLFQALSAGAAPRDMSTFEVRQQFASCGFELGNPSSSTPFVVLRDPGATGLRGANARIVMAIIYRDTSAATAAHRQAHQDAETRLGEQWAWSDDHGPQLLAGYGGSVWRGNVALVQSSSRTLASMWTVDAQTDEARVARPELFDLGFDSSGGQYGVDRDFVACLDDPTYAQQALPTPQAAEPPSPVFLPGRPW